MALGTFADKNNLPLRQGLRLRRFNSKAWAHQEQSDHDDQIEPHDDAASGISARQLRQA